jgi:hypothetical protein
MTLRDLEKRLEKEPDNLPLRVTVAGQMRDAGRKAEAVELYRSVAVAYRKQGRSQQAIAVCRSILELAPDDIACHALLAELVKHHEGRAARDSVAQYANVEVETRTVTPATASGSQVEQTPVRTVMPEPRPSPNIDSTTPLPRPVPYHVHEPTSSVDRIPRTDVDLPSVEGAETRPGAEDRSAAGTHTTGLAEAARRISGLIAGDQLPLSRGSVVRLSASDAEPATRERAGAADVDLEADPEPADFDDAPTPVPPSRPSARARSEPSRDTDDDLTAPRELIAEPARNAFFAPLPPGKRDAALQRCHERALTTGTVVIRQGETAHPLFLVVAGRLEVRAERANGTTVVLELVEPGDYIGEAALLGRTPAPANVAAVADTIVLALPPHALFELAGAYPALWAALKDTAERRTRQYERAIRAAP